MSPVLFSGTQAACSLSHLPKTLITCPGSPTSRAAYLLRLGHISCALASAHDIVDRALIDGIADLSLAFQSPT